MFCTCSFPLMWKIGFLSFRPNCPPTTQFKSWTEISIFLTFLQGNTNCNGALMLQFPPYIFKKKKEDIDFGPICVEAPGLAGWCSHGSRWLTSEGRRRDETSCQLRWRARDSGVSAGAGRIPAPPPDVDTRRLPTLFEDAHTCTIIRHANENSD